MRSACGDSRARPANSPIVIQAIAYLQARGFASQPGTAPGRIDPGPCPKGKVKPLAGTPGEGAVQYCGRALSWRYGDSFPGHRIGHFARLPALVAMHSHAHDRESKTPS